MISITEQSNPRTAQIDRMSTLDMLHTINDEDRRVALAVQEALPRIAEAVDAIAARMEQGGRLLYIGAGTSGRLGILDAVECVPTFSSAPEQVVGIIAGGEKAIMRSVEGAEDDADLGRADVVALNLQPHDTLVGIAASGTTPYVLAALQTANEQQILTVGIACNVPSPLLEIAHIKIGVSVGPEVISGSTRLKAGTAQKMVLNMLSTGVMVRLGKVYGNQMVDVQITNEKLARRARHIVSQIAQVDEHTAEDLLRQAGKNVKVAIIMHRRNVPAAEAQVLLYKANGRLRDVIG
jgi:N-acetylmuramic acid 6-phosphate etherase